MSLKPGAKRPLPGLLSDSFGKCKQQAGKWETCLSFSTFPRLAAAVGMWESRFVRFPRTVEAEGNLPLVFLGVHRPAFPQFPLSSCRPFFPRFNTSKQVPLRFLHPPRGLRITVHPGLLIQPCNRDPRAEISSHVRQLPQDLPGRGVPAVASLLLSLGSHRHL